MGLLKTKTWQEHQALDSWCCKHLLPLKQQMIKIITRRNGFWDWPVVSFMKCCELMAFVCFVPFGNKPLLLAAPANQSNRFFGIWLSPNTAEPIVLHFIQQIISFGKEPLPSSSLVLANQKDRRRSWQIQSIIVNEDPTHKEMNKGAFFGILPLWSTY